MWLAYERRSTIRIFGPLEQRPVLEPLLVWATPGQRGFSNVRPASQLYKPPVALGKAVPSTQEIPNSRLKSSAALASQQMATQKHSEFQKAAQLREMLATLEKVDDDSRRASLLDVLCSAGDVLNLPLHPNPPGIGCGLKVNLMKHQVCSVLHYYSHPKRTCRFKLCNGL